MSELGETIIALRLAGRRACMCERDADSKSTLSLKTKILFLFSRGASPKTVRDLLVIGKTNLSALTRDLTNEGMIERRISPDDRRAIFYSLTNKGEDHLSKRILEIERLWHAHAADTSVSPESAIGVLRAAITVLDDGTLER